MKGTPCYADLDEFWVIGDFLAKKFMGWGGGYLNCYVEFNGPLGAERFSSYREALRYMNTDEDAAEWVKKHGGSRFARPLRCRTSVVVYPPRTKR